MSVNLRIQYSDVIDVLLNVRYTEGKEGGIIMTSINVTTARKNLYQLITDVNENSTPITITNSRGRNAVLISEEDWNALQETLYLNSVPGLSESILAADQEAISTRAVYDTDEEW